MKQLKSNYQLVKNVVERVSQVDITAKSRKHHLPYIRYVYYRICKDFDKDDFMISHCSKEINQKHDLAIYGLKRFDDYKDQTFFSSIMELYKECTLELESELAYTPEEIYTELLKVRKRVDYLANSIKVNYEKVS